MEQCTLKNVNNDLNTNIYLFLKNEAALAFAKGRESHLIETLLRLLINYILLWLRSLLLVQVGTSGKFQVVRVL